MDKTRIVLTGCGAMSRAWFKAALANPDAEIAGIVDIVEDAAQARAREFGLDKAVVGTDLESVLAATRPDVVFDVTVPEAHMPVTLKALRHGCHVLGEKPLADNMANACRMVAAAEEAGRIYAVIQNRRYDAAMLAIRQALQSGLIGQVHTLHADFFLAPHFGGFREKMRHPLLLDMAIHTFDQARFLSCAGPAGVYCREWNPPGSWFAHGASAVALFDMTGNIAFAYNGSWCAEGCQTSWNGHWRIIGDNGTLRWDGKDDIRVHQPGELSGLSRKPVEVAIDPVVLKDAETGHAGIINEFIRCVRHGGTPQTVCTDNIKSLAMVFGAIESAEKGQHVDIDI